MKAPIFNEGDRVLFIGDSITHTGLYSRNIFTYFATRYPNVKWSYINKGITGGNLWYAIRQYGWDTAESKGNKAFILFGMNDLGRDNYVDSPTPEQEEKKAKLIAAYENNLDKICLLLRQNGIGEIILGVPSIFDETAEVPALNCPGYNDTLKGRKDSAMRLANKYGCKVVDFNAPLLRATRQLQKSDPTASILSADRVHPQEPGAWVMLSAFLQDLDCEGMVASLSVTAEGEIIERENCFVGDFFASENALSFHYQPCALPLPVNRYYLEADALVGLTSRFNREILSVSGLREGLYTVSADGETLGVFSDKELSGGINLAAMEQNPNQKLSQSLFADIEKIRSTMTAVRDVRIFRTWMESAGIDWNDKEAEKSFIEQKQSDPNPYIVGLANKYFQLLPQEYALTEESEELKKALFLKNSPKGYNITIKYKKS